MLVAGMLLAIGDHIDSLDIDLSDAGMIAACFALTASFLLPRIPRLSQRVDVHAEGAVLNLYGKNWRFRYDTVDKLTVSKEGRKHRNRGGENGPHVATLYHLQFKMTGGESFVAELESRRAQKSEKVVNSLIQKLHQAIRMRMMEHLESGNEVAWTPNVSLTMDGLLVRRPGESPWRLPLGQIETCQLTDEGLKLFGDDGTRPMLIIDKDQPNFVPAMELFSGLHQVHHADSSMHRTPELAG